MDRLEKKFGKLAIPRLTMVLLIIQAAGYILFYSGAQNLLREYLTLDPYAILHGQVWRLITWLLIPTSDLFSFALVALLFYLPIGTQMERVWGDFKYTLYIFLGLVFTVLGAFFLFGYNYIVSGGAGMLTLPGGTVAGVGMEAASAGIAVSFSPYYVMMSIFFAFAATFPDSMVLFMFLVPLKMKWLGFAYGGYMLYSLIRGTIETRVVIIVSVLNFVVFFLWSQKSPFRQANSAQRARRQSFSGFQQARQTQQRQGMGMGMGGNAWSNRPGGGSAMQPRHRCAVCGVTDISHPDREFRYCSKCKGAYEYCQEHLFTHTHVQ